MASSVAFAEGVSRKDPVDRLAGDGRGNLERLFLDVLEKGGVA